MPSRNNLYNKLKSLGITVCSRVGPYLVLGGIATDLYILMAPSNKLESETCENALAQFGDHPASLDILYSVLVKDTGIYIFNTTGMMRGLVIPMAHWAWQEVAKNLVSAPRLRPEHLAALEDHENELVKAVSSGIFIAKLPFKSAVNYAMLPLAGMSYLARLYWKRTIPNFRSASLPGYKKMLPDQPRMAMRMAAVEAISSGINLGAAFNVISDFMVDTFYDSTHENDLPYQTQLLYGFTALGFIAGVASMSNERAHQASNHVASTMQTFYLICMPLLSMTMCFVPSLEDINTFMQKSIYIVLAIAAFSLAAAEIYTRLTSEERQEVKIEPIDDANDSDIDDEESYYITINNAKVSGYGTLFTSHRPINDDLGTDEERIELINDHEDIEIRKAKTIVNKKERREAGYVADADEEYDRDSVPSLGAM